MENSQCAESLDRRLADAFLVSFPVKSRPKIGPLDSRTGGFMKTCTACAEEFEDKFSSCPVDGTPMNPLTAALAAYSTQDKSSSTRQSSPLSRRRSQARSYQYQPTILSSAGLLKRLAAQLKFLRSRFRNAWPDLKRDPFAFAKGAALDLGNFLGERW